MFIKPKPTLFILFALFSVVLFGSPVVYARIADNCPDGYAVQFNTDSGPSYEQLCRDHQIGTSSADSQEDTRHDAVSCSDNTAIPPSNKSAGTESEFCQTHGGLSATGVRTGVATYSSSSKKECTSATLKADDNCKILKYLVQFVNLLSAVVGIVVVIMIAIGGLQYSASRDNPQATAAAKAKIQNALLGLVAYLFVYAFLQYIIPGGAL